MAMRSENEKCRLLRVIQREAGETAPTTLCSPNGWVEKFDIRDCVDLIACA
jgi:hypothetical protein